MAKPTPGPLDWVAVPASQSGFHLYITDSTGRKIAALWGRGDEKEGNARLFAAAPEMLAALREAATWLRNGDYDTRGGLMEMDRLASVCEEAVSKAEGAQP